MPENHFKNRLRLFLNVDFHWFQTGSTNSVNICSVLDIFHYLFQLQHTFGLQPASSLPLSEDCPWNVSSTRPKPPRYWPVTKSPMWPLGKLTDRLWWLNLLRNPWLDEVTAAHTRWDTLCEMESVFNLHLYSLCLHDATQVNSILGLGQVFGLWHTHGGVPTSSTSHSWSPHFTSFL